MINRLLQQNIKEACFKSKVIILLGARQVGKTTLLKNLQNELQVKSNWLNADEGDVLDELTKANTSSRLMQFLGEENELVIIDEAQQIPDIGKKLKLLHDNFPDKQFIATGSSAFELKDKTNEPLTGRKITFHLYPISYEELKNHTSKTEINRTINSRLVFGNYPEIINNPSKEREILIEIANSYLYKDILKMDGIRKSNHLEKLLQALAFQLGNEVNFHELAQTIGNIDTATVEKYLDLLEKTFVIFKLPAFSRNLRNEIKKGKKYYFYDNGIRNVLLSNYALPDMRLDKGALWENYLISERMKFNAYHSQHPNSYFWRTHDQAEIDLIEEQNGILNAYEIKWKEQKVKFPNSFLEAYPQHTTKVINSENFSKFISI
jgi:predicted AAA+ superfamily ATPase